ncbi:unnamed protein product [Mytilus edulis]|uniref:Ankyrin repeat protein n=1 Tax=Mytilus edulis TaxID=6550 RepID=A0A8S3TX11_MYTED|nr:unnamed protein product [Mytilus edulis]
MFHESAFLQYPSKKRLMSSLRSLSGSYVTEDIDKVVFVHETMKNIVLFCIAKTFMKTVIKYCKTEVFLDHIRLDCIDAEQDVLAIKVPTEHQETYFRRLVLELNNGLISTIFTNQQNKCEIFRCMFLKYIQEHLEDFHMNNTQKCIAMHVISTNGYREYVSFFLQDKSMAKIKDSAGNTPLHTACKNGHLEVVTNLIETNSKIYIANTEGIKPLFYACENNHLEIVKLLLTTRLKEKVKINEKYLTKGNRGVLHVVAEQGFTDLAMFLLKMKADVNIRDVRERTPLHLASKTEHSSMIPVLLEYKANINAIDVGERTPLYVACSRNQKEIVKILIDNKADINLKIRRKCDLCMLRQFGSIEIVKLLIENGAKLLKNESERCVVPLHQACKNDNEDIVKYLIICGSLVNHKNQ